MNFQNEGRRQPGANKDVRASGDCCRYRELQSHLGRRISRTLAAVVGGSLDRYASSGDRGGARDFVSVKVHDPPGRGGRRLKDDAAIAADTWPQISGSGARDCLRERSREASKQSQGRRGRQLAAGRRRDEAPRLPALAPLPSASCVLAGFRLQDPFGQKGCPRLFPDDAVYG